MIAAVAVFVPSCTFTVWRDQVMRDLMEEGRLKIDYNRVGPGGGTSQTVEFFDAGSRHIGYGIFRGGSAEFFNVDGSRAGFGRIGR